MKKNIVITAVAVIVIVIVMIVAALTRPRPQNADTSNADGIKKIQNALLQFGAEQLYQPLCRKDIISVERSGDVIKVVSKLSGGAPRYKIDDKEVACPLNDQTPSPDCLAVKDLVFTAVYTCPAEEPTSLTDGRNGLKMKNQVVGNAVIVDLVVLEHPGYVRVYSRAANGQPGDIIGTSPWISAGYHEIVSIAVSKTLQAGKQYFAGLNLDNGDRNFQESSDLALTTPEGQPRVANFQVAIAKK